MLLFEQKHNTGLSPIIKWAGGKEKELPYIIPNSPEFENYYEPFVGGGSVFSAFSAQHYFINDKSTELINLYRCIATSNAKFYDIISNIILSWNNMLDYVNNHQDLCDVYKRYRGNQISDKDIKDILFQHLSDNHNVLDSIVLFSVQKNIYEEELRKNLLRKIQRMKKIETEKGQMPESDIFDNIETAFMSSLYMYFRGLYNNKELMQNYMELSTAIFLFIRNFAYSGMFRYNDSGEFNVPYGGIGYNHKSFDKKIKYYQSKDLLNHFANTTIDNLDFEDFFAKRQPTENDFVFLDPPYDSEFSTYAKNEFTQEDQKRLANYLIDKCKAKWMMVIKYTPFIYSLYNNHNLNIKTFDKKYLVSFMNRNDKKAEHLMIMNYQ